MYKKTTEMLFILHTLYIKDVDTVLLALCVDIFNIQCVEDK